MTVPLGLFGGVVFSPSDVTGLQVWAKASSIAQADGTTVTAWPDSSGNGRTLAGTNPVYKTNILNGLPVVRFSAGGVSALFTAGAQPHTMFVVGKRRITSSGSNWYFADGFGLNQMVLRGQTAWDIYAGGSVVGTGSVDANWHMFCAVYNGASSKIRVDGGAGAGGSAGTTTPTGFTLGSAGNGTTPLDGDIAEALLYTGSLSLADINSIGGYLASKYALTWTTAT